jgi:hypothetical protein
MMNEDNSESKLSPREIGQNVAIEGILRSEFGRANCNAADDALELLIAQERADRIVHFPMRKILPWAIASAASLALLFVLSVDFKKYDKNIIARLEAENADLIKQHKVAFVALDYSVSERTSKLERTIASLEMQLKYRESINNQSYRALVHNSNGSENIEFDPILESRGTSLTQENGLNKAIFPHITAPFSNMEGFQELGLGESFITEGEPKSLVLGGYISIEAGSHTNVNSIGSAGKERIRLIQGTVLCEVSPDRGEFSVETNFGLVTVTGTKFEVSLELKGGKQTMRVTVLEGTVVCTDNYGNSKKLSAGQQHVMT